MSLWCWSRHWCCRASPPTRSRAQATATRCASRPTHALELAADIIRQVYALLCAAALSGLGCLPLYLLPLQNRFDQSGSVLRRLLSMAFGSVVADVFLHMLPEVSDWIALHTCRDPPCRCGRAADGKAGSRRACGSLPASCSSLCSRRQVAAILMVADARSWLAWSAAAATATVSTRPGTSPSLPMHSTTSRTAWRWPHRSASTSRRAAVPAAPD